MLSHHRAPFLLVVLALIAFHGSLAAAPFRFLAWDDAMAARKFAIKSGEQMIEIKNLHPLKRTGTVNVGVETVPLLVAMDKKDAEGKPLAVEIKMPADLQSPLVLIIPDPKHPTGVKPFVIDDNTARFKWGTMRVLNATGKTAMIKVDQSVAQLPPNWTPVDIDPGGQVRNMGVQAAMKDKPTEILYSAVWEHDPDVRELIIVLPSQDARTGALEFKVIPENRKVMEAEAAAGRKP